MDNINVSARQLTHLLESLGKPVVLVGSAGSGKSTVGRRVAKKAKLQFYDSDQIIEQRENMSVVEIYEKHGQDYFSQREREVVQEVLSTYGVVILSTGSNAFVDRYLHDYIKANAITIWLYADTKVLAERISRRNSRPGFTPENTYDILKQIVERDYPLYGQANISIESHEHDIYKVVDSVIVKLTKYLEGLLI
jgi:shikimate kinase